MLFIGVFFCLLGLVLGIYKLQIVLTGKLTDGEIVGYVRGAKSTYGFIGYNYRIRVTYKDELYYVTAVEGPVGTSGGHTQKNLGKHCTVYFNPKKPNSRVTIKGFRRLEWMSVGLFIFGILAVWTVLAFT